MGTMSKIWRRARLSAAGLLVDCRGIAATEFAVIVPVMLVMFFGVVEISNGVAVDRKVTLVARTLTDLTGQVCYDGSLCNPIPPLNRNTGTIVDNDLLIAFSAAKDILQPYSAAGITNATISEVYVDNSSTATVTWSEAATFASDGTPTLAPSIRKPKDVVTGLLPPALLQAKQTYVIFSEVKYLYKPAVGYVMGTAGVTLNDVAYTRPRQVQCVVYTNLPVVAAPAPCPTP